MGSRVEKGARVRIVLEHHQLAFPQHMYGRDCFEGEVTHMPSDVGDMLHVRLDDGTHMALNPSSRSLVAVVALGQHEATS